MIGPPTAARWAVLLGLAGCAADDEIGALPRPWPIGRALVADLSGGGWSWGTATALEPFVAAAELDPGCAACIAFQGRVRTAYDGEREAVLTWSQHDGGEDDLRSRVGAVALDGTLRWMLDAIDLRGIPGACDADPDDPCAPAPGLTGAARRACQLTMAHDVAIADEDDAGRTFWVADASNARVLEIRLEDGARCGVVRTALDADTTPDWDVYNAPNRVHAFRDAAGEHLWISAKGGLPTGEAGVAQSADLSSGKLTGWTLREGAWRQDWEFPPQDSTQASFLNTPHGLAPPDPSDPARLLYAHSLSDSWEWGAGTGGSVGLAHLNDAGEVAYDGDAVLDRGYLHFPRAVTLLPDGSALVLDSGCFDSAGCTYPSQAWRVELPAPAGEGRTGAWDRDASELSWTEARVIAGPLWTTDHTLYAVDWVPDAPP